MKLNKAVRLSMIVAPLLSSVFADGTNVQTASAIPQYKDGYTIVEANGFTLKIGGSVKADAFYDIDSYQPGTTYQYLVATLPLKGSSNINAYKKGNFNGGLGGSQFYLDAKKKFGSIDVRGYIETDFAGTISGFDNESDINQNQLGSTTNNFLLRMRHAFMESCGLLIGQTTYTFADTDAMIYTLENIASSAGRQLMARYTFNMNKEWSFAVAAERPNTQIFQIQTANGLSGSGAYGDNDNTHARSRYPDGAAVLKYATKGSHISLRGLVRSLQAKTQVNAAPIIGNSANRSTKKDALAWGVGVSGKLNVMDSVKLMGLYDYGHGLGRYVDELNYAKGVDAVFIYPTAGTSHPKLKALKTWKAEGGVEVHFTDKLWANVAYAYVKITKPKSYTTTTNEYLHKNFERIIANVIYDVLPNVRIGLEALHYRKRISGYTPTNNFPHTPKGKNTRVLTSLIYKI